MATQPVIEQEPEEPSVNNFRHITSVLARQTMWGPLIVTVGFYGLLMKGSGGEPVVLGIFSFMVLAGVAMMFKQLASNEVFDVRENLGPEDASYIVRQLSKNYEILRAQTAQGFLLSGVFMTIGLLLIVASLFAPSFGAPVAPDNIKNLGAVAGIVTEFISGSALLLYRLNFRRLNETSDRLDDAWRVLAAYKLTQELPDDKKADATLQLISALTKPK